MNKLSDRDKRAISAGIGITAGIITGSAMVDALPAKAVEIGVGDQSGIYDYLNAGQTGLVNLDFQLDEDEDGNRSTRVKIYVLQSLAFSEQSAIYDQLDFSAAPDTVTVSGSGGVGFYRTTENGDLKQCTLYSINGANASNSYLMASAPDFRVTCSLSRSVTISPYYADYPGVNRPYFRIGGSYSGPRYGCLQTWHDALGYLSDYTIDYGEFINAEFAEYCYTELIPVVPRGSRAQGYLCGGGARATLPPGTVDTESPWDYYNNVLLPYMEEEFPGYDEYFVFPDGYTPPEPPPQVPTEYPTLPGWDFTPVADGTLPAGAESVAYEMPEIPTKTVPVPAFDLTKINPAEVLSPFAEGFRGIWDLIADVLVSFDLLPVVSLCFLVLIVCAFIALGVK